MERERKEVVGFLFEMKPRLRRLIIQKLNNNNINKNNNNNNNIITFIFIENGNLKN